MSFTGVFASLLLAAQIPPGTVPDPRASALQPLGFMILMMVVLYVIMIRPQQKKAKEHAKTLTTLKSGDKIVTSGGILGVIVTVKDKTITVRSGDTKLELLKSAVSEITERAGASAS